MLKIKLKRFGKKKFPIYRIILSKNISKKIIKILGFYNPIKKKFIYNYALLNYYLNNGVYISKTLRHLLLIDLLD